MKAYIGHISAFIYIISICCVLFFTDIHDFPVLIPLFSCAFIAYAGIYTSTLDLRTAIVIGIIVRFIAIFSFPSLSDDIYRFIWDGKLIVSGYNPFAFIPNDHPFPLSQYQQFLLNTMNSPEYYSVYPTVLQGLFALTAWIIPSHIIGQAIFLKLVLFAFELVCLHFLWKIFAHYEWDKRKILWYFLNPLVVVELMGNLHMESIMIAAFAGFIWYIILGARGPKKYVLASFALSFSVAAKLITLVSTVFLYKRMKGKNRFIFFGSFALFLFFLFVPMFLFSYQNFGKGLDLYFQKFEFNASLYYMLRTVGFWITGYNIIHFLGPILAIGSGVLFLAKAIQEKEKDIISLCTNILICLSFYYICSTTVHPWYIALLVFLSIFGSYKYAIMWSFLAILSYSKYYEDGYLYSYMVFIEYACLFGIILYEYKKNAMVAKTI